VDKDRSRQAVAGFAFVECHPMISRPSHVICVWSQLICAKAHPPSRLI
jgi:hypothetical protein